MPENKYSAGLTHEIFWLQESRKTAELMPEDILRLFTTCDVTNAKLIDLIAILKDSRIFFEFMYEVFDEKLPEADTVVIAAPFWDLSFPAILKKYIEAVTVAGITFRYSDQGHRSVCAGPTGSFMS